MGTYANGHLMKDERVIHETTYHWMIFISLRSVLTLFISPILAIYSDEFVITNKRVIIKTGLISRKTLEMNLSKIESVNVNQSILGRIFGYGDIIVKGTGGTIEMFHNIRKAMEFRKKFQEIES